MNASSVRNSVNGWDTGTLRDVLREEGPGAWGDEPDENEGVPVLRATNFGDHGIDLQDVAYRVLSESQRASKRLGKGDIVVERSGGSPNQPVGRVLFFDLEEEYYPGNFLHLLRPRKKINNLFLYYVLDDLYRRGGTVPLQTNTTTIRNLQFDAFLSIDVPLPPQEEQRKIASVLYTVDELIENSEEIITALERAKRGIRRRLLKIGTREGRLVETETPFGKLPERWSLRYLEDVAEVVGGTTPSTEREEYWDGTVCWATPTDITEMKGQKIGATGRQITSKAVEECALTVLPAGSLLLTSRASIGNCAVNTVPMATNQGFQSLVPSEDMNRWYLYYLMRELAPYLESLGAGSTFKEISNSVVKRVQIPVPSLEEQKEIAEILRGFDRTVVANRKFGRRAVRLKQGLMQDLLRGEVRTNDVELEVPEEVAAYD